MSYKLPTSIFFCEAFLAIQYILVKINKMYEEELLNQVTSFFTTRKTAQTHQKYTI